jgi:hypothetical protein
LTKGKDWSYEAEWRMMVPFSSASRVIGDGSTAIHLFEFPKSMVRRVICGCRMSDSKKAEIRQILLGTPEYENVQCVDARVDETRYRVLLTDAVGTNRSFQQSA